MKWKRLVAFSALCALCVIMATSAFASTKNDSEAAAKKPRIQYSAAHIYNCNVPEHDHTEDDPEQYRPVQAESCGHCEGVNLTEKRELDFFSDWGWNGEKRDCPTQLIYSDYQEERLAIYHDECQDCGAVTVTSVYQQRWHCTRMDVLHQ